MMDLAQPRAWPTLARASRSWRERPAVTSLCLAVPASLTVGLLQGARPFYPDSGEYWALANSFTRHGHFSLLNFESPWRGYVMALITYVLKALAGGLNLSPSVVVTLFVSLLFALIGAVLAPRLAELTWPERRWGTASRLGLCALLLVFWAGALNYPMTDFPALAAGLFALVAVSRAGSPAWMLAAGASASAAIELRPSYLPLAPAVLVIAILGRRAGARAVDRASVRRRTLCVGLLVVGFVGVALPQSLATHRYYHMWSFVPGAAAHLEEEQLTQGVLYQRYDTYDAPVPLAVTYIDAPARELLERQPGARVKSVGQYLGLIVSHPGVMTELLGRHLVNGMDARYNTMFVERLDSGGRLWLRLCGFLLVFLALLRLAWAGSRKSLGEARWRYPVALSLCALTAVPSTMETRYMLPIYLLTYLLVLTPGWPNPLGRAGTGVRRVGRPLAMLALYLAFMAGVWGVVGGVKGQVGSLKDLPSYDPQHPWVFVR
jgi:hypothetical protein